MPSQSSFSSRDSPLESRLQDRFRLHFDPGLRFKSRIEKRLRGDRDTDDGEDQQEKKRSHVWAPRTASDFASTTIQRHIRTGFYDHPTRGEARFRARYRVPRCVYAQLKADLLRLDPSLDETTSRARRRDNLVPIDNRILTTLRILGRGMTVQDDLDHSGMSADFVRKTFKRIIRLMSGQQAFRQVCAHASIRSRIAEHNGLVRQHWPHRRSRVHGCDARALGSMSSRPSPYARG